MPFFSVISQRQRGRESKDRDKQDKQKIVLNGNMQDNNKYSKLKVL